MKSTAKKPLFSIVISIVVLLIINSISAIYFKRIDLTKNQRYTLSEPAKEIIEEVDEPIIIDVFLKGDFPSEFKRLQNETRYMLEEFSAYNRHIKFNFINPLADGGDAQQIATRFYEVGMTPETLNEVGNGKTSESILFPWAVAYYKNKSAPIHLLKKKMGDDNEVIVNSSIQQLEYAFADGFNKLVHEKEKKIAVMRGNGELPDANIADFLKSLKAYYNIGPFTLDSIQQNPEKTLENLNKYDLILEAKPTEAYTEEEKYVLDQYLMNGGKALWLAETVIAEKDSLFNPQNTTLAYPTDLNLTDFFFKYGVRINPSLVNDVYSAPIVLARGSGNQTQFNPYPWFYSPLAISEENKHPIVNNIEAVKFDFANPIDTLKNGIKKTILLRSSHTSKVDGTPKEISLKIIEKKPAMETYTSGSQPLAVLLEGKFSSVYNNRIKPFSIANDKTESPDTKMLVISDGDVIKNELRKGEPTELGFDRYTGTTYGNKEFLLNAVNYLLDDTGLLNIRSKEVKLAFLDSKKIAEEKLFWQIANILLPLSVLFIFGLLFTFFRKKKYTNH